jgi:hypothetical protein
MNEFSKEERVAFEDILEGFQDALVLSKNVSVYSTDQSMMERAGNVIWRPEPYIMQSFNGTDQTLNFKDATQLSVPATIGFNQSVPWVMTATELRDALQEKRLGDAAKLKLASDINIAVMNVAALQGSLVVARGAAASGFADVAAAAERLRGVAHRTPVRCSRTADEMTGARLFFKCENFQRMGAFKFRGAYNALAQFSPEQRRAGVITYSSGNHAQAIALSARLLGMPSVIVMPHDSPAAKLAATRGYQQGQPGSELVMYDRYTQDREAIGQALEPNFHQHIAGKLIVLGEQPTHHGAVGR